MDTIEHPRRWHRASRRLTRRLTSSVGAFGITAAIFLGQCAPSGPACTPPPPPAPAPSTIERVVAITNQRRAEAGLWPLAMDGLLNDAARVHSQDQAARGRMGHEGSDGSSAGQRISRTGYVWRAWGENVAYGQGDAAAVMSAWMGSSGHRANILSGNFTEIGVGLAYGRDGRPYWTMVLAAPR